MAVFKFKAFDVVQQQSAMKVGTDSVLLGALVSSNFPKQILDIGTGTGLLALMMAQRFEEAKIEAIEIDEQAVEEATFNVDQSKWRERVDVFHQSLQDFAARSKQQFDLIVSNPPYYEVENQFNITAQNRLQARHTATLSFDELLQNVSKLLSEQGTCWMVLPATESGLVLNKAEQIGLYCTHRIYIYPNPAKPFNRLVFCLAKSRQTILEEQFFIKDEQGAYSQQYREVTMPFLLWNT